MGYIVGIDVGAVKSKQAYLKALWEGMHSEKIFPIKYQRATNLFWYGNHGQKKN